MVNEMVERVMLILVNEKRKRHNVPLLNDLKHLIPQAFDDYKADAQAAIQAMRKPTNKMLDAGAYDLDMKLETQWQRMIDAALK